MEKKDSNKQFIWLKLEEKGITSWLAVTYFAPRDSKLYKKGFDNEDPYDTLKKDILNFGSLGEIVLMGNLNARIANNQRIQLGSEDGG